MNSKIISLFFVLFTLTACDQFHEIGKKSGVHFIKEMKLNITNLKNIEWDIGKKRETTISKGIRFSSTAPNLSEDNKIFLRKKFGIDSWIIKVSRKQRRSSRDLGYFYIRLRNMTRATKSFTVNLYYHAASVSKKFRFFHCPAFGHRFTITSLSLNSQEALGTGNLYIRPTERFPGKPLRLRFAPMVLSGGRSLLGKYTVSLALYNSKTKQRYSDWMPTSNTIDITKETARSVPSCRGIVEENFPLPESHMPSIQDLEIK